MNTKNICYSIAMLLMMNSLLLRGGEQDQTPPSIKQKIKLTFNNTTYHQIPHNAGSLSGSGNSTLIPSSRTQSEGTMQSIDGDGIRGGSSTTHSHNIPSQKGHVVKPATQSTTTTVTTSTTTNIPISPGGACASSYMGVVTANPCITGGVILLGGYCAALMLRYTLEQFIIRYNFWTFWHEEIALCNLTDAERADITQELITRIYSTHNGKLLTSFEVESTVVDSFSQLQNFIQEIHTELTRLKNLLRINAFLRRTKLVLLMPQSVFDDEVIHDSIEHVHSIKTLFLDWLNNDAL